VDDGDDGEGKGKDEGTIALADAPELKEVNESLAALKTQLFTAQKGQRIAELEVKFPYGSETFKAIKDNLNECESIEEIEVLYENQVKLLKAAKVPEAKRITGQARFLATDSVTTLQEDLNEDGGQQQTRTRSGLMDESTMLADAGAAMKSHPEKEIK
jgi:hypothetical protein